MQFKKKIKCLIVYCRLLTRLRLVCELRKPEIRNISCGRCCTRTTSQRRPSSSARPSTLTSAATQSSQNSSQSTSYPTKVSITHIWSLIHFNEGRDWFSLVSFLYQGCSLIQVQNTFIKCKYFKSEQNIPWSDGCIVCTSLSEFYSIEAESIENIVSPKPAREIVVC